MKIPLAGRSSMAKMVAVFAIVLLVSLGLCGANFALFSRYGQVAGPEEPNGRSEIALVLMGTGFLELLGMALGAGGLIVVAVTAVGVAIYNKITPAKNQDE